MSLDEELTKEVILDDVAFLNAVKEDLNNLKGKDAENRFASILISRNDTYDTCREDARQFGDDVYEWFTFNNIHGKLFAGVSLPARLFIRQLQVIGLLGEEITVSRESIQRVLQQVTFKEQEDMTRKQFDEGVDMIRGSIKFHKEIELQRAQSEIAELTIDQCFEVLEVRNRTPDNRTDFQNKWRDRVATFMYQFVKQSIVSGKYDYAYLT